MAAFTVTVTAGVAVTVGRLVAVGTAVAATAGRLVAVANAVGVLAAVTWPMADVAVMTVAAGAGSPAPKISESSSC
jgi:hypothetical protein